MSDDAYFRTQQFRKELRNASKALKALPKDVQKQFKKDAKQAISVPLAAAMKAAAPQPWSKPIKASIVPTGGAIPGVRLGSGTKAVASGGAKGRDLIPGVEWGGGQRRTANVVRTTKKTGRRTMYRRKVTTGFAKHHHPFVYEVIAEHADEMATAYLDMVAKVLQQNGLDDA